MSVIAVVLVNLPIGPAFESWWSASFGFELAGRAFTLPLLDWINHGLLTIFFLVVGLEIKREFTVGHLAALRAASLPVVAALSDCLGGGELNHWGIYRSLPYAVLGVLL